MTDSKETKAKTHYSIDDPPVDPPDPPLPTAAGDDENEGRDEERQQRLKDVATEQLKRLREEEAG